MDIPRRNQNIKGAIYARVKHITPPTVASIASLTVVRWPLDDNYKKSQLLPLRPKTGYSAFYRLAIPSTQIEKGY